MHLKLIIIICILVILGTGIYFILPAQKNKMINMKENKKNLIIRQPAVAGSFYPADKNEVLAMLDKFLANVKVDKTSGVPRILIVPHAGYVFSGQTAAYAFKQIKDRKYEKVILLGNSHQEYFSGLALDGSDKWQTLLGQINLDKDTISKLAQNNIHIKIDRQVHLNEHSLEVEVLFLQHLLNNNFKLIPGLFGSERNLDNLKSIALSLEKIIDGKTLVIISTDLSHYPSYEDAKIIDKKTINAILALNPEKFLQTIDKLESQGYPNLSTCACGWPAVVAGLELASHLNLKAELLHSSNSGDIPIYGDKNKVVGYTAIGFYATKIPNNNPRDILNQKEQQAALKLARQTLENFFDKTIKVAEDYKNYPIFNEKRGVFVTLHKNGELRGCIGLIEPPEFPLSQAIQQMALAAAFNDSRFMPLAKNELDKIKLEISILTVPKKINNINEIELGKHGVILRKGMQTGVFLPQVALETGWNKEKFLSELCSQKAGLPANCYQDPKVEIYTFMAQVFGEKND